MILKLTLVLYDYHTVRLYMYTLFQMIFSSRQLNKGPVGPLSYKKGGGRGGGREGGVQDKVQCKCEMIDCRQQNCWVPAHFERDVYITFVYLME